MKAMDAGSLTSKILNAIRDSMLSWRRVNSSPGNREIFMHWNMPHSVPPLNFR